MSEINKILGRLEVTGDIGEKFDKSLEQADASIHNRIGARQILLLCAKEKLPKLHDHIDKDLEEGRLAPGNFQSELEIAAIVKKYVTHAIEILLNIADRAKSEELVAQGKAAAIRESLDVVRRHHVSAKARADQIMAALEEAQKLANGGEVQEGEPSARGRTREAGQHPGSSNLDERRRAAMAAQLKPEKAETTPDSGSDAAAEKPKKPRRRRARKPGG